MADEAVEAADAPPEGDSGEQETFTREYVEGLRKENAKYRTKAQENASAAKDLDKLRTESLSEVERAVQEAKAAGRTEAASEFGARLVRSAYEAAAARRNPSFPTDGVIDDLNMARFVSDDGEPDLKAIEASVLRLIPLGGGYERRPATGRAAPQLHRGWPQGHVHDGHARGSPHPGLHLPDGFRP